MLKTLTMNEDNNREREERDDILPSLEEAGLAFLYLIDRRGGREEGVIRWVERGAAAVPLLHRQRAGSVLQSLRNQSSQIIWWVYCRVILYIYIYISVHFLPFCFWPAPQWHWLTLQRWGSQNWRVGRRDGKSSVEIKRVKEGRKPDWMTQRKYEPCRAKL